jgi:hypothetical protein
VSKAPGPSGVVGGHAHHGFDSRCT